ncbi:hypothetical protein [Streptomyces prunicolor]|uniref:hypothetical protein n=1 Tax=Streptomyces prunicolor TaxID=67348 RepID=UPI0033CBCDC3
MDDYDSYIDSVLYSDQTADNYTPYGANGIGAPIYGVVSLLNDKEELVYEGEDSSRAEREAINAYERSFRKAEVLVMQDGSNWKWVFCLPKSRFKDAKPVLTQSGFCIDPRCGEINPLDCYCRYGMTPDEIKRYAQYV